MVKLSIVIITFNEEKNIERCLNAVKNIADEIVVVDSFSTDKTEAICKAYKVKFIQHAFEGHIEQKNWAISQASHPHILSLDADEAPNAQLVEEIKKAKENFSADGYTMNRLTNYCGKWIKHCGWYPDKKLRLWDSRKGTWCGENPHDRYELAPKSSIKHLKGDLLHYSYYSIEEHKKQTKYFTSISAKAMFKEGKKPSFVKNYLSPLFKFLRNYFFELGFLDGKYGFIVCRISAHATYLKYHKLRQLYRENLNQ